MSVMVWTASTSCSDPANSYPIRQPDTDILAIRSQEILCQLRTLDLILELSVYYWTLSMLGLDDVLRLSD